MEDASAGEFGARFDALIDPAVRFKDELGTLDGRQDLRAYIDSYRESFGGFHVQLEQARDLGETLLLQILQGGRGTGSGIDVEQHFTWIMLFENDRIVQWEIYANHAEALAAIGLSE
jgi:hypothetical protein